MATELERLMVRIDATTEQLRREIDRADKRVSASSRHMEQQNKKISQSFDNMGAAAKRFASIAAASYVTRKVLRYADSYKRLENQLKVVAKEGDNVSASFNRLFQISQKTRTPLEATVTLFQRVSLAQKELGASQKEILQFTENIGKALAIQGGSAASATGALLQLSQALGSGIVRAEEFNSILEGAFPVAQAAARGIDAAGGSVAKLRSLIADGQITSDQFFRAILSQSEELDKTFGRTAATVAQSFTTFENSLTKFVGSSKSVQSATAALSKSIVLLAENLDGVVDVIAIASAFFAGKYAVSLATATAAQARKIQSSIAMAAADAASAKAALSAAHANFVMSTRMAQATGNMALARAASLQLTAAKNAYTAAATRAAVATRALGVAMQTVIPLAAIAAVYEMIDGNESLIESERLLGEQIDETRAIIEQQRDEHGNLTDDAKKAVAERIAAYMKEVQALEAVLKAQLDNRSAIGLTLRGIRDIAGESVIEGIFGEDYQSLDEAYEKQNKLNGAIAEMRELLKKPMEGVESATFIQYDENTRKGINDRISALKEMRDQVEIGSETEKALGKEVLRLEKRLESLTQTKTKTTKTTKENTKATKEAAKADKERTELLEDQREEMEALQKQVAEEFNRPFENAMESVQSTVADTFQSIFDGSVNSADDAADAMKRIFTRLAAEMATLAIFRPQVLASGGFGAIGGSMVNGASTFSGGMGGGFDISSLSSLGGLFTSGGLGQPIFSSGSFIGGGIDSIGNALGLGNAGFIGPMPAGQAAPLSGAFTGGAALAGIGGSMLAGLLGLGGGIGGSIGGAAGGIAGTALGAQFGSIGGPIGAAAGAFLGTALGGLFGGSSRPHPAATVGLSGFSSSGQLFGTDLQAKHLSEQDAKTFAQSLGTITGAIAQAAGIDFSKFAAPEGGTAFQAGVNDGKGFFTFGSHKSDLGNKRVSVTFNPDDEEDLQRALGDLAKLFVTRADDIGQEVNQTLLNALDNIETAGRSVEDVVADIAFASGFDQLGDIPQQTSEIVQAFDALKQVFFDAAKTAERLGLEVDKVREFEQNRIEAMQRGFAQSTAMDILNIIDPAAAQGITETQRYQQHIKDLQHIGATQDQINEATLLHQLRMQQITDQNAGVLDIEQKRLDTATDLQRQYQRVESSFKSILSDLEFGRFTGNTPVANLDAMRARINELSPRAALGDIAAQEELADLLPAFLELSGEVNGYNAEFARDRQLAQSVAEQTLSVAERQINLQQREIDKAQEQIDVTRTGFANLDATMEALGLSMSSVTQSAQGMSGLNPSQAWATEYGRSQGLLNVNETATGGLLASRLDAAGGNAWSQFESSKKAAGFARGGLVIGQPGNDNIPARLSNQEFVMRADAVRSIGIETLNAMNSTGRMPNGGDVSTKLDALINATMAVGRAVADSGNLNASKQQEVVNALDGIKRSQRVAALS